MTASKAEQISPKRVWWPRRRKTNHWEEATAGFACQIAEDDNKRAENAQTFRLSARGPCRCWASMHRAVVVSKALLLEHCRDEDLKAMLT